MLFNIIAVHCPRGGEEILVGQKRWFMLRWTLVFLVFSLVAALLGFGGLAAGAAEIARICFFIFLVLFLVSLIFGGAGGGRKRMGPPL